MKTVDEQLHIIEENAEQISDVLTLIEGDYTLHLQSRDIISFKTKQEIIEISKEGKVGLMTKDCKIIVPPTYDSICSYSINTKTIVFEKIFGHKQFEKKVGVADFNGNILLEPKYDQITYYNKERYVVRLNYQYAVIGRDGKIVLDFGEYDFIDEFVKGVARVKKGNKWGLIDNRGFAFVSPVFDEIWKLRSDISSTRAVYKGENFYIHVWNLQDPERMYTNPIHFYKDVHYKNEEYPELGLDYREELKERTRRYEHYDDLDPLDAFEGDEEIYNDWLNSR